jgi:hypothetical protein
MSNDTAAQTARNVSKKEGGGDGVQRVYLVSYPKIVFLYPTFLAAIVAGIYMLVAGDAPGVEPGRHRHDTEMLSLVFLIVLTLNLVVLSFDFPRATSLTLFFLIAAVVLGAVLLFKFNPQLLPVIGEWFAKLSPWANAQFYLIFAGIATLIYIGVLVSVQFDLERFSAPNLRFDKEINDIFEYLLLRSGRLILHPSNERRAIVLENVFFISKKEKQLTQMLGALQVQVRSES